MTGTQPCGRQRKLLDAGPFEPMIGSFWLHLAAEGQAVKTVRIYADAVAWFAAARLLPETDKTSWKQVSGQDVQRWVVGLLGRYSDAYANNQFRALQQFFKWLAAEEEIPDVMAGLRAEGDREARAGVHQRRTVGPSEGVPGPVVHPAPRRSDPGGTNGHWHPGGRAGRDPLRRR
jgi:hypothetical protein